MDIECLFIKRKYHTADEPPELLVAWDEYSVDENLQGWNDATRKAIESVEGDLSEYRFIKLRVHEGAVSKAFEIPVVQATA